MFTWWSELKPLERAVAVAVGALVLFGCCSLWLDRAMRHAECIEALKQPNMEGAVRMALCKP